MNPARKLAWIVILFSTLFCFGAVGQDTPKTGDSKNELTLWDNKPATNWLGAMPLGNGRLGAMVFGGVGEERLVLNENTLYSGEPEGFNPPIDITKDFATVTNLIQTGQYAEADSYVTKHWTGRSTPCYQPLGNLRLKFDASGEVSDYVRELDLKDAVATVSYRQNGGNFQREVFASHPDDAGHVELTLDHVEGGEVSGWFHTVAKPGDEVELRGPLSGFFAWPGDRPALLLGAGSGVVPLMSMLRQHRARNLSVPLRLVVSARSPEELIYAREYGAETTPVFTRSAAEGVPVGRMAAAHVAPLLAEQPPGGWEAYVCGSNGFAEHASRLLVEAGQPVDRIRIERFG